MKKAGVILALALLTAALVTALARPIPVEHRMIGIQVQENLGQYPHLQDASVEVQAALLDLGDDRHLQLKAQAALIAYPDMAADVLPLYASETEFQDILRRYGESILPPIHYFLNQPVRTVEWMNDASRHWQRAREFIDGLGDDEPASRDGAGNRGESRGATAPGSSSGDLSAEQRGWYAVNFIHEQGHDFLGQFLVDSEGRAQWVQTARAVDGITRFFTSGIRQLETSWRADEEITAGDIGWASVDVLVFASAVKVLRAGRTATQATRGATLSTRSAAVAARVTASGRLLLASGRYAKWPLIIGTGYLLVRHPTVISDVLASAAGVLGYPVWAVQLAGWLLLLVPLYYIASWLLGPLAAVLRGLLSLVNWLRGRRTRQAWQIRG